MKPLCLLFMLIAFSAQAEEAFEVYVNTFDPDLDTKMIEGKSIKIEKQLPPNISETGNLPDPTEMKKMLVNAGLESDVKKMDQIQADVFFLKVWKRDPASVKQDYKNISPEKIDHLKKIIDEAK